MEKIENSNEYKNLVAFSQREKEIDADALLDKRKSQLQKPEQEWVFFIDENIEKKLHRKPENEQDTLAIL